MTSKAERLAQAERAIQSQEILEALAILAELEETCVERWVFEAEAWMALSNWAHVERSIEKAMAIDADAPQVLSLRGSLALSRWQLEVAQDAFARLIEHPEASEDETLVAGEGLAVLADLRGDHEEADSLWKQVSGEKSLHLSEEAFDSLLREAAEELPTEFRKAFERVPVVVDLMPSVELVGGRDSGNGPDILGLFVGHPLWEEQDVSGELPARIHLFQRNLEREFPDRESVREEIRTTLFHELGHALGFDEDGVEEMGLA